MENTELELLLEKMTDEERQEDFFNSIAGIWDGDQDWIANVESRWIRMCIVSLMYTRRYPRDRDVLTLGLMLMLVGNSHPLFWDTSLQP